jgi:hypothetical protein
VARTTPSLYRDGLERVFLNFEVFWTWMLEGIIHAVLVMFLPLYSFGSFVILDQGKVRRYAFVASCKTACLSRKGVCLVVPAVGGSLGLWHYGVPLCYHGRQYEAGGGGTAGLLPGEVEFGFIRPGICAGVRLAAPHGPADVGVIRRLVALVGGVLGLEACRLTNLWVDLPFGIGISLLAHLLVRRRGLLCHTSYH